MKKRPESSWEQMLIDNKRKYGYYDPAVFQIIKDVKNGKTYSKNNERGQNAKVRPL